jgi:hypothetical protein
VVFDLGFSSCGQIPLHVFAGCRRARGPSASLGMTGGALLRWTAEGGCPHVGLCLACQSGAFKANCLAIMDDAFRPSGGRGRFPGPRPQALKRGNQFSTLDAALKGRSSTERRAAISVLARLLTDDGVSVEERRFSGASAWPLIWALAPAGKFLSTFLLGAGGHGSLGFARDDRRSFAPLDSRGRLSPRWSLVSVSV